MVNSIINVVPDVVNVLLLTLLFYVMFGIIFVQYFKGKFMGCQGEAFEGLSPEQAAFLTNPRPWGDLDAGEQAWFGVCGGGGGTYACCDQWPDDAAEAPTSRQVCGCLGAGWGETVPQNFDNIVVAVRTLFEMATTEGWVGVLLACVDATGVDMQPVRNHAPGWALFVMLFMIIGSFFFMNLFVGVLYERFTQMQKELKGRNSFLTAKQADLIETQRLGLLFKPQRRFKAPDHHLGRGHALVRGGGTYAQEVGGQTLQMHKKWEGKRSPSLACDCYCPSLTSLLSRRPDCPPPPLLSPIQFLSSLYLPCLAPCFCRHQAGWRSPSRRTRGLRAWCWGASWPTRWS